MSSDLDAAIPDLGTVTPLGPSPAIQVRDLWYSFGNDAVLRGVSFNVEAGEIFGFIGPNGAGKTTTIRLLATLLEPRRGSVEIQGHNTTLEPEAVRAVIGYLPDHTGFYEQITIREYLEFFARARRAELLLRVPYVLELTRLIEIQHQLIETLSKGMRQRLSLARALLHDPSVLILDEPANGADPRAQSELRALFLDLSSLNKTIFLSSHVLSDLSEICTRVGIIDRGLLLAVGSIADIATRLDAQSSPGLPHDGAHDLQRVRLRVAGDPTSVVALLSELPAVVDVQVGSEKQLSISYKSSDQFVAELIRYLVGHGVSLQGVEPEQNELERIFLGLTEKKP